MQVDHTYFPKRFKLIKEKTEKNHYKIYKKKGLGQKSELRLKNDLIVRRGA